MVRAVAEEYEIPYVVHIASAAVMQDSLYWYDKVIVNCNEPGFQQVDLQARELDQYHFRGLAGYQRWEVT